MEDRFETHFQAMARSLQSLTVDVLALNMFLVEKGICKEEDLTAYRKKAEGAIHEMYMVKVNDLVESVRKEQGDDAASDLLKNLMGEHEQQAH